MDNIRRWTRTIIPGTATLLLFVACTLLLVPGWRPMVRTMLESGQGALGWAGIGLVASTLMGYIQSHVYFGLGWEWMTIPYERFRGAEVLGPERTRSRAWAMLSHKWQKHALCIGGFDSINERLEGLGDGLHALGGVIAGTVLAVLGLVCLAFAVTPRPGPIAIIGVAFILLIWSLTFVRAFLTLRFRFEFYVRDNLDFVILHESANGTRCLGRTKEGDLTKIPN